MKGMELQIDQEKNIAFIKLTGQPSREDIVQAFDAAVQDEKYKKGMGRLWDFRDADLSSFDTATIVDLAQHSLKYPPGINDVKVAFVTGKDIDYGLSRMFEMASASKTPINVYRSMDEAEKWMME